MVTLFIIQQIKNICNIKIAITMMSGKEKLYFLLNRVNDVRVISPSSQPLKIHPMDDLKGGYREVELTQLFTKLEKDELVLKVLKAPGRIKTIDFIEGIIPDEPVPENDDGCWHIELLSAFDSYFLKIQQEPEYQEFMGKKPPIQTSREQSDSVLRKPIFGSHSYQPKVKEIADNFSPENYNFVLMVLRQIISLAEFSPNGKVNYQLQSPPGQNLIKERSLLQKFEVQGLFKNLGEDEIFGIATLDSLDIPLIKELIAGIEEKISDVISSEEDIQPLSVGTPYCVVENGLGYLKFGKHGKKKKIGKASSRHFRLLQTMLSPVGVSKTTEVVFEAIRLLKDKNDTRLSDWNTSATRKVELIEYAIKELQKGNKLEGKIKFEFNNTKTQLKAKLLDYRGT